MFQLKVVFLVLWVFLALSAYSEVQEQKKSSSSPARKPPLTLQWEVSHPRNTDQISLIFRETTVELVTNTSSYQKGKIVWLGRFDSPLTLDLKDLKEQVGRYYNRLQKTVPLSSLIKDPRVRPAVDPHAPVLRINEEEISDKHPYFKPLASIIYQVWEKDWLCIECATYKKKRKSIVRTVKRKSVSKTVRKSNLSSQSDNKKAQSESLKNQWKKSHQSFPKKLLDCVPKGNKKVECIDPQFGIFKI